jgi:hypothetical protein
MAPGKADWRCVRLTEGPFGTGGVLNERRKAACEPPIGSREALLDIQTLARATSESGDMAVRQRDVEKAIAEMLLPQRQE